MRQKLVQPSQEYLKYKMKNSGTFSLTKTIYFATNLFKNHSTRDTFETTICTSVYSEINE